MPIFEYRCQSCHKEFELLRAAISASEKLECPHCESQKIEKLISSFGFKSQSKSRDGLSSSSGASSCSACTASTCAPCKG